MAETAAGSFAARWADTFMIDLLLAGLLLARAPADIAGRGERKITVARNCTWSAGAQQPDRAPGHGSRRKGVAMGVVTVPCVLHERFASPRRGRLNAVQLLLRSRC